MISIVIPLYNKADSIKSTLDSVIAQTWSEFEIIIIDDGSTDNSVERAGSCTDKRIRLIRQENQGVSAARNRGIEEARFDYIAFLDADDEWENDYLECQVNLIRSFPGCGVFGCAYQFRNYKGIEKKIQLNNLSFEGKKGILTNYFVVASSSHPPLWTSAVVVEKKYLIQIGGFPVGIKIGEDLLAWARLAVLCKIAYRTEPKAFFVQTVSESYVTAPSRSPEPEDRVGLELERLYKSHPSVSGLKGYVSLWFKMRASMFLLLNKRKKTVSECIKALQYNWKNGKVWMYLILILFPKSFRYKIFQKWGNQ